MWHQSLYIMEKRKMDTIKSKVLCNPCLIAKQISFFPVNLTGIVNFALKRFDSAKKRLPSFLLRDNPNNYNITLV